MKKMVAAIFAAWFLYFFEIASAEFTLVGEKFSGFASSGWESQYVFSIGLKASNHPRSWQEFSILHEDSGIYAGASFSESPSEGFDGRDDKDFNFGIIRTAWVHKFNAKFSHIWIATAGPMNELSLRIDGINHPFYWKGSYLIGLKKRSPESGFLNRAGLLKAFSVPLPFGRNSYEQSIAFEAYVGGTIGGALGVKSGFTHAAATVAFPMPLIRSLTLEPKFGLQFTFPNYRGSGKGDISKDNPKWGALTLTYRF
nr:MAG: hypothetical protein UV11_C0030G0008 [Candidatus Giovannonibacteria bacterium GW2011_GWF2_42_19]